MNRFKYIALGIVILMVISISLKAQNIDSEIESLNKVFLEKNWLSFNIDYHLYENYTSRSIMESKSGNFVREGEVRRTNIDGFLNVFFKDMLLIVDSTNKTILIGNPVSFGVSSLGFLPLDSMRRMYSAIKIISNKSGKRTLVFLVAPNIVSPTDKIEITYNAENYQIERIVLYYREKVKLNNEDTEGTKMRLEVLFSQYIEPGEKPKQSIFPHLFIEKKQKTYVGAGQYKDYKIIDQRI